MIGTTKSKESKMMKRSVTLPRTRGTEDGAEAEQGSSISFPDLFWNYNDRLVVC